MFLHQRDTFWETTTQSPGKVIIEKSRGGRFFMEQELKFLGWIGPVWQLLRPVFPCFHGQKKIFKNILDGKNIFGIE